MVGTFLVYRFVGVVRSVPLINIENSELIDEAMSIALGYGRGQDNEACALREVTCKEEYELSFGIQ